MWKSPAVLMAAVLSVLVMGAMFVFRGPPAELSVEPDPVAGSSLGGTAGQDPADPSGAFLSRPPASPSLATAFEQSGDLKSFVDRLTASDYRSDPDAAWFVARAYEYCSDYASDPAEYANQTTFLIGLAKSPVRENLQSARDRVQRRCYRFPSDGDGTLYSREAHIANALTAASAGSVAAEAWLLWNDAPFSTGDHYVPDLARRVKASRDPEAYAAIAEAIGIGVSPVWLGSDLPPDLAYQAWRIAACRIGADCSRGGSFMTRGCSAGGDCFPYPDYETLVARSVLAPMAYEAVRSEVDRIVAY